MSKRANKKRHKNCLGMKVNTVDGGFPAWIDATEKYSPNQLLISVTSVDLPLASGPTNAIIIPPLISFRSFWLGEWR